MLRLESINVYYGAIHAIHDATIEVREGEIVSLIGANGAGKTSILRTISGLNTPQSGNIFFNEQPICLTQTKKNMLGKQKVQVKMKRPHEIVAMGIGHVPEGRRVFPHMSVYENLLMGAYSRKDKNIKESLEQVYQRFVRLYERRKQEAGTLSGGEQQMLAMGRALMSKPKLLLLDEPSMGLAPMLVDEIFRIVEEINKAGTTILLVEQNAHMALSIANRGYVLETGNVIMKGPGLELLDSPDIRKAYLGD